VKKTDAEWNTYRTRFLIKAKQLSAPMVFVDALGREHGGRKGDYLMESSEGMRRIAPREFFEHAYVPLGPAEGARRAAAGVLLERRAEKARVSSRAPLAM